MINIIHYAVEILTDSTNTEPSVGMVDGVLRYTTDNYSPIAHLATYEQAYTDLHGDTIVTGDWEGTLLSLGGIKNITSRVDITDGGSYSFSGGAVVELANSTTLNGIYSDEVLASIGVSPVGARVNVFVVIDNIFYSKWSGVVEKIEYTDKKFRWVCKDAFNNDDEIVDQAILGQVDKFPIDTEDSSENEYIERIPSRIYWGGWMRDNQSVSMDNLDISILDDTQTGSVEYCARLEVDDYNSLTIDMWGRPANVYGPKFIQIVGSTVSPVMRITNIRASGDKYSVSCDAREPSATDTDDCFGFWESVTPTNIQDSLEIFNGTVVRLYEEYDETISSNVNVDNILTIENESGSIINDNIVDTDDEGVSTIRTESVFTVAPIANESISYKSSAVELPTVVDDDYFDESYDGHYTSSEYQTHTKLNVSSAKALLGDVSKYDKVYLGVKYRPRSVFISHKVHKGNVSRYFSTFGSQAVKIYQFLENSDAIVGWTNQDTLSVDALAEGLTDSLQIDIYNAREHGSTKYQYVINVESPMGEIEIQNPIYYNGISIDPMYGATQASGTYAEWESGWGTNLTAKDAGDGDLPSSDTRPIAYNYNGLQRDINYVNSGGDTSTIIDSVVGGESDTAPDIREKIVDSDIIILQSRLRLSRQIGVLYSADSHDHAIISAQDLASNYTCEYFLVGVTVVSDGDSLVGSGADVDTNTVPKLIKALTNNEGEYSKLVERDSWAAGRYLAEEVTKNSILTHLCKTAQILGYTNRMGQIAFNTFRESSQDVVPTHDGDIVLENSIKNAKTSSVDKIYNSFNVRWAKDFTTDKPTKFVKIGNVKEDSFPAEGIDFRSYVDGVESYSLAKEYWDTAKAAYDTTTTVNKAPDGLTNCLYGVFSASDSEGASYGYYTLVGLLEWNTKAKLTIPYKLPITSDTVKLEVGSKVVFNDFITTNGADYEGWITSVGVNTTTDEIGVDFTYVADEQDDTDIVETPYNTDEIIEDGANVDEIIEQ